MKKINPIRRLAKRIKKARKAKRASQKYRLDTPEGGVEYSKKGGLQFLSPKQQKQLGITSGFQMQEGVNIPGIGNVPTVALLGIPLIVYLMMQKKKRAAPAPALAKR